MVLYIYLFCFSPFLFFSELLQLWKKEKENKFLTMILCFVMVQHMIVTRSFETQTMESCSTVQEQNYHLKINQRYNQKYHIIDLLTFSMCKLLSWKHISEGFILNISSFRNLYECFKNLINHKLHWVKCQNFY